MNRTYITTALVLFASPSIVEAARFVSLGTLPGGAVSRAVDVSADGTTVVGSADYSSGSVTGGNTTFKWSQTTGMGFLANINSLGTNVIQHPSAISGDGSVVVGSFDTGKPFKWSADGGVEPIAPRLAPPASVSYDGSIVAGGNGATDISWDGSVVVGTDSSEGYRETLGRRTWLGDLPGGDFVSEALAVSPDGSFVVGRSATVIVEGSQQLRAGKPFYWTEATGMVALGPWSNGWATDVSGSKLVIVGSGIKTLTPPEPPSEPFRWTPSRGMESVRELLLAQGVNVTALGWQLGGTDVSLSADGRIMVGTGIRSGEEQAWLVELDVPGDFDADGDSDGLDFLKWQRGFGDATDQADLSDWRANLDFLKNLQQTTSATASLTVPEPTYLALAAALFAFGLIGHGRGK